MHPSEKHSLDEAALRMQEEQLYAQVLREMESSLRRDGLWAKALVAAEGSESKARAVYIELRVQSLRDEIEIAKHAEAAEAEAAVRRQEEARQSSETNCIVALSEIGYAVNKSAAGWVVREPLGGRTRIKSMEELLEYARVKLIQRVHR